MAPTGEDGVDHLTTVRLRRLANRLDQGRQADERRWGRRLKVQRIAIGAVLAVACAAVAAYTLRSPGPVVTAASTIPSNAASSVASAGSSASGLSSGGTVPSPSADGTDGADGTAADPAAGLGLTAIDAASSTSKAVLMYGRPRSGLPWHSGFWTGGDENTAHITAAGVWRGRRMDFATTYPRYGTWAEIQNSQSAITDFTGFHGKLAYGLPLLPTNRKGKWTDVTSGSKDAVFRKIAKDLVRYGQPDAAIRMGVEANGYWFPWGVSASTADEYRAAFRRIVRVMRAVAPKLTFWMDMNYGTQLEGATARLAPLTMMYPGDDVVDGISLDHYNAWGLTATSEAAWANAIAPRWAPGLKDAAAFARRHHKGFAVPEWGLNDKQGPGDSPFFMTKMFQFFMANRDVLVFENYFNEPDPYIGSAIYQAKNNPKSAAVYLRLWGRRR